MLHDMVIRTVYLKTILAPFNRGVTGSLTRLTKTLRIAISSFGKSRVICFPRLLSNSKSRPVS